MTKVLTAVLIVLVIGNIAFTGYSLYKPKYKLGFIYIDKAYDEFKGKKEIEREFKSIENRQNSILDSVKFQITDLEGKLKVATSPDKQRIQQLLDLNYANHDRLVKGFSDYNSKESQKQMQSLLKQINQYVKDYGDEKGYDFIYGANGSGSLMYAGDKDDITKEVTKYINVRYEGK